MSKQSGNSRFRDTAIKQKSTEAPKLNLQSFIQAFAAYVHPFVTFARK